MMDFMKVRNPNDGSTVKGFAHRGIMKAALRLKQELEAEGKFPFLFFSF